MKLFIALGILLFSFPVIAQTTQKFSATKANEYGLVYKLPLTELRVTVEAERVIRKPGEFYRYSKKYLSIDPITELSETWTLKSAVLTTAGVPDPEEEYLVQFKAGSTPFILLDEKNLPLAINTENYRTAAIPLLPVSVAAEPTILESPAARQAMTEEMLQSKSSVKRAELAAAKIYELRQSRNDIISGQADQMPSDGKAMQLALDNLSAQEAALTAMFSGTEQKSTEVATFTYMPEAGNMEESSRIVIGRISATEGIVDADDLSGEPIYLDIKVLRRGELPLNEKGEIKRFPKGALAYRLPGEMKVSVVFNGRTITSKTIEAAQLGVVFGLDPTLFTDKKSPAYVTFDPVTGAVIELGTVR